MLKIIVIFVAAFFINTANSFSQTNPAKSNAPVKKKNQTAGFYGKRFTMQLGGGIHHNTILKLTSGRERVLRTTAYYNSYRKQIKNDQFNYSFYGNIGIVLKEHTALSFDFQYYTGDIFLQNINRKDLYDDWGNLYTTSGYDARVKYNTMRFMPRIEIGSRGSNMPTGLVNILGLGIELSKLKSGNYKSISAYDSYYDDSVSISNQNLKFDDVFSLNLTLMYGLEYRLAISKNIAWNFGGYVHLNLPVQEAISDFIGTIDYGNSNYEEEHKIQLSRYRFQNLFSVRTGLVIML